MAGRDTMGFGPGPRAPSGAALLVRPDQASIRREIKGLGYRHITDLTGVPVGTVKSSLDRGRGQLRARLAAAGWQPRPGTYVRFGTNDVG